MYTDAQEILLGAFLQPVMTVDLAEHGLCSQRPLLPERTGL